MRCPNCNEPVLETDRFCGNCGYSFDDEENYDNDERDNRKYDKDEDVEVLKIGGRHRDDEAREDFGDAGADFRSDRERYDDEVDEYGRDDFGRDEYGRDDLGRDGEREGRGIFPNSNVSDEEKQRKRTERREQLQKYQQRAREQFQAMGSSSFMKDLGLLVKAAFLAPSRAVDERVRINPIVNLSVIGVFVLLYSILLYVIALGRREELAITAIDVSGRTGFSSFLYILMAFILLFATGYILLFLMHIIAFRERADMRQLFTDYTMLLMYVFVLFFLAWLLLILSVNYAGMILFFTAIVLFAIIPVYLFLKYTKHNTLKVDSFYVVTAYTIIATVVITILMNIIYNQFIYTLIFDLGA